MKKLLSIILGIMIFMVPLSGFADVDHPYTTPTSQSYIIVGDYDPTQCSIYYAPLGTKWFRVSSQPWYGKTIYTYRAYNPETNQYINYSEYRALCNSTSIQSPETLNYQWGFENRDNQSGVGTIVKTNATVIDGTAANPGQTLFSSAPEVFAYQLNPGDYARFTKPPGYTAASMDILVSFEAGNNPYLEIKNYNNLGSVNNWNQSPLAPFTTVTENYMDIKFVSSRLNEPITVNTVGIMEKLATGGAAPPDGTVRTEQVLTTNPDTLTITNYTGEDQKITYWRAETGQDQYTTLKIEKKIGGLWQVMGATPNITDTKERTVTISTNSRWTIYNHFGTTKVSYPVMEGFNVSTSTQGTGGIPNPGGGIVVPDDPSIITNPGDWGAVPGAGTTPTMPDDVVGMLKWMSTQVLDFLAAMGESLTGMFAFLARFGAVFASITFLPPQFTIAFVALITVSLALRVVGR